MDLRTICSSASGKFAGLLDSRGIWKVIGGVAC